MTNTFLLKCNDLNNHGNRVNPVVRFAGLEPTSSWGDFEAAAEAYCEVHGLNLISMRQLNQRQVEDRETYGVVETFG